MNETNEISRGGSFYHRYLMTMATLNLYHSLHQKPFEEELVTALATVLGGAGRHTIPWKNRNTKNLYNTIYCG
jgi:hypothetical protein